MSEHPTLPFLLFDLDGTISDPLQGIFRSLKYALEAFGYDVQSMSDCKTFIGPQLEDSFRTITGSTDTSEIMALIEKYRERYGEMGYGDTVQPGNSNRNHPAICFRSRMNWSISLDESILR